MDELLDWIHERRALLIAGLVGLALGAWWWQGRPLSHPAGILASAEPVQTAAESTAAWTFRQYRITPLADFQIQARVLSRERYRFDRPSQLSPVDFALGWGPMSDSGILKDFTIEQRGRWYFWSTPNLPIPAETVISHSANMHMIPADPLVERLLLRVRVGQIVSLRGKLIRADAPDGWHWVSSLTRTDTGDGSCEVVWVDSVTTADD